ncbi:hypothetical protein Tco_1564208 [Tanacetum coccineum]
MNLGPAEMDFRSFMMEGVDGEFKFLIEDGLDEEGNSPSPRSINNEALAINAEPLTVIHPSEFAKNLDVDSDPDIHEFPSDKKLKDSFDFHWVVAHVTPPSWKQHLKEISLEKLWLLVMLFEKAKSRRIRLMLNWRGSAMRLFRIWIKIPFSWICVPRLRLYRDRLTNSTEWLKSSKVQLLQEINSLRKDRGVAVSKVVPHVATELVRGDEIDLKDPFVLEKMPGYRPSGKEFDQAGDDLATTSYPFIAEVTIDPYATVEQLLSKKPRSLRIKPASSYSKPSSSKAPIN